MDNNEKDEELRKETPENKEQQDNGAKSFWKETPFDEMQHVKPDSFAGIESGNKGDSQSQKNQKDKNDPDAYWRPRDPSGPRQNGGGSSNGGGSQRPNPGMNQGGNNPLKSRRNRIGLIIFAGLLILFALTLFSSRNNAAEVSYTTFKTAVENGKAKFANSDLNSAFPKNSSNAIPSRDRALRSGS